MPDPTDKPVDLTNKPADQTFTGLAGLTKAPGTTEGDIRPQAGLVGDKPFAEQERDISDAVLDAKHLYSSHPIMNFRVGRFQFEKGLLTLTDSEDAETLEKLLKTMPMTESIKVKKLDPEGAARLVLQNRARPAATKGFDSATGERASDADGQRVGVGDLAAQLQAAQDNANKI